MAASRPRSAPPARRRKTARPLEILVTGGTGFVGAHSVKALTDAGHRVRLLVRDPAKVARVLDPLGLDAPPCIKGDMTDEGAVLAALDGCDAVLHCAAVVSVDRNRSAEMLKANPLGARLVVGHAARLGLDPIVHVSSVAAIFKPGLKCLTAELPLARTASPYGQSKAAAERFVRGLQAAGAPVVITYPGSVIGPSAGDVAGEPAAGVEAQIKLGRLPTHDAAWSLIDARDLGLIHAALMRRGQGPRRFMCGGHYLDMDALAATFSALTGRPFPVMNLPGAALRRMGSVVDWVRRHVSIDTPLTHEAMVAFTQMPPTDDSAVHEELGVAYRPVEDSLRETLLGLARAGRLTDLEIGQLSELLR